MSKVEFIKKNHNIKQRKVKIQKSIRGKIKLNKQKVTISKYGKIIQCSKLNVTLPL